MDTCFSKSKASETKLVTPLTVEVGVGVAEADSVGCALVSLLPDGAHPVSSRAPRTVTLIRAVPDFRTSPFLDKEDIKDLS
jgi:hypothetical protein